MQEQKVLEYESRMSLIKWDVFSMTFYQKMTDLRPPLTPYATDHLRIQQYKQLEGTCDAGK